MSSTPTPIKLDAMLARHDDDVQKGWKQTFYPTGIKALDAAVMGLPTQVVTTIGANQGTGKSILALSLVRNTQVPTLWCSYEDPWRYTAERAKGLRNPNVDFTTKITQLRDLKFAMDNYKLVVIDYLQLIEVGNMADETERAVIIMKEMSHYARDREGLAIVMMSQLNKPDQRVPENSPPTINSLSGSREVARKSKMVLLLHRPPIKEYERRMDILVAKKSFGPGGQCIKATFDGENARVY